MRQPEPISQRDVAHVLDHAVTHRLRGEDDIAESMCLDVLEAEPGNQAALEIMLRILAGRIARGNKPALGAATLLLEQVRDPGTRAFCSALIHEAQARRLLARADQPAAQAAQDFLQFALEQFDISAQKSEDPLESRLRANACLRAQSKILNGHSTPDREPEHPIE
ncbi:hypothetical protein RA27_15380 [Ruegeria sp. ANG-R]|uniref:hypothetical protein n=1 Tax=Ruegeria sp. ANG-R TaxID=1577903 RepID=UPI00057CBC9C|nr:hypothetical protein [Ruegeria sp. ANG-R]KIC40202.1 hypothetical protein RA27_15380 [Ruegeria sp. ANG-R]